MAVFDIARWGVNIEESENRDDLSSAWKECVAKGEVWGGRAKGGRGIRLNGGFTTDVSVDGVEITFAGNELLTNAKLRFQVGHRYGFIGANGAGKSTLLRRMARGSIPGFPIHLRVEYVQQELPSIPDKTVGEFIFNPVSDNQLFTATVGAASGAAASGGSRVEALQAEEEHLAELLAAGGSDEEVEAISERMCAIAEELERLEMGSSSATDLKTDPFVVDILKGLKLETKKRSLLDTKLNSLSGGWRMRAALARSLINVPNTDILLLDEATNHLDMHVVAWLEGFLTEHCDNCIVLLVSHDRQFLDNVTTDIVELKDKGLAYFSGNYSDWVLHEEEVAARNENRLDAQTRKEEHVKRSIEQAKARGHTDVAKAKVKKLERASMNKRLDGKKFHTCSLKKLSEEWIRFPEKIEAIRANRVLRFKFPDCDTVCLRLSTATAPVLSLTHCQIGWDLPPTGPTAPVQRGSGEAILTDVMLQLTLKSRIALVGPNGQGKSTLIQALMQSIAGDVLYSDASGAAAGVATAAAKPKAKGGSISVVKTKSSTASASASTATSTTTKAKKPAAAESAASLPSPTAESATTKRPTTSVPYIRGEVTGNHNLRWAFVSQNHIDTLSNYLSYTPVEYTRLLMQGNGNVESGEGTPAAAASVGSGSVGSGEGRFTDTEIRAHLGMFGLGGDVALRTIGSLSGGQKARLAFAAACVMRPHVLFLDEPTNHLSMEGMEALAVACRDFNGAVICASHNRHFLTLVCNELWIVDNKRVTVRIATETEGSGPASSVASTMNANASTSTTDNDTSFAGLLEDYIDSVNSSS